MRLHRISEIKDFLSHLPERDREVEDRIRAHQESLVKPVGALGRLEDLVVWLGGWQGSIFPTVERVGVWIFAGEHGVVVQGVSAYPSGVTSKMVETFHKGGAAINQLCKGIGGDLRIYEPGQGNTVTDFTRAEAMSEEEFCRAFTFGMQTVEEGLQVLCLGEMGIGNTTSASAVCFGLFGGKVEDWVGRGTGLDDQGLQRKRNVVEEGVKRHYDVVDEPLKILQCLGGYELAALGGAILKARLLRIPVVLDGFVVTAAASVLFKTEQTALLHCLAAHRSAENAHGRLLKILHMEPVFDLGMRLGEGSAAVLVIPILRGAIECHRGMFKLEDIGFTHDL